MVKWDMQHTLVMIGTTLVAATVGYIEQQDATTLLAALQSLAAMKHMLVVIAVIDLSALAALAKQSFLVPSSNGGAGQGQANKQPETMSFPKKPAAMRESLRLRPGFWRAELGLLCCLLLMLETSMSAPVAIIGVAGLAAMTVGCNVLKDPVYVAEQLAQYVTLFIGTAQTIWSAVQPLLGASAAADDAVFNDAIVTLENANATLVDVAQAVAAGKVGDLAGAIKAVQDAVARVMAVIAQFQQSVPAARAATASKTDTLSRMATSIQHWGQP